MPVARVSSKGQIVIPADIRRRHGIRKGTPVVIEERGSELVLRPRNREYFEQLAGILGTDGESWTEALLEERRLDREREDR